MVLSVQRTEYVTFPPLDEGNNAPSCRSFLSVSSLPVDNRLVNARLCSGLEARDIIVSETEKTLTGSTMGVWEEVAKERKGVSRPGYTSE